MAFVHTLVRWEVGEKEGWIAPFELGDETPGYVSFAVPVEKRNGLFDEYRCEFAFTGKKKSDHRKEYTIYRKSATALVLSVNQREFWFFVTPSAKGRQRLPYVGKATHEDFAHDLMEIEPRDLNAMDRLCDEFGMFVVGCDPIVHYGRAKAANEKSVTS